MAFTLTTLTAAVGINDTTALLTSLTGLSAGNLIGIDKEIMKVISVPSAATVPVPVLRGQEGSAQVAHPVSAQVKIGATPSNLVTADWTQPSAGAPSMALLPAAPARDVKSYSVAGAITLPTVGNDMVAILNGTTILAMTLANPTTAQDGSLLFVIGNGKAAHTVTYTAGLGNVGATADVFTFVAAQAGGLVLMAAGGFWVTVGTMVAGAATIAGPGIG